MHERPADRTRPFLAAGALLAAGLLADQASKAWAATHAAEPRLLVPGYLGAYAVRNAGATLGLGGDRGATGPLLGLLGVACAALLARLAYADRRRWRRADCLACAAALAGIGGNTLDRLTLGHVRDFLVAWAMPGVVFNVADLLVVVGAVGLLIARGRGLSAARADRPRPAAA